MNWDIEAPNVVTEARFRELVESGYSAEILCQESAHKKGPSYYGVWIMRVVSDEGVEKLLVTARTRTTYNDIKIREFKTITGVVSFLIGIGFSHADVPLEDGTSGRISLRRQPAPSDKGTAANSPSLAVATPASAQMVLVMESDGSLTPPAPRAALPATTMTASVRVRRPMDLAILGETEAATELTHSRFAAFARPAPLPRADVLTAIEATALRYAGHPGLRRAGLSVTDWLASIGPISKWRAPIGRMQSPARAPSALVN